MILFRDRTEAGVRLARRVADTLGAEAAGTVVLGIPRGGIEVAVPVAVALGTVVEPVSLRKLPLPGNDQMGFGAVTLGRRAILNREVVEAEGLSPQEIDEVIDETSREVERRDRLYRGRRPYPDLTHRNAFIVDDGLATGYTMLAAVTYARESGAAAVISAVPVAHAEAYDLVRNSADSVISLHVDHGYPFAVASFYADFPDLTDAAVLELLHRPRRSSVRPRTR